MKLVSDSFVPVALNADRLSDTDAGKFFHALIEKQKWPQGLWVVTPEGKVLGFHYHKAKSGETYAQGQQRWVEDTIAMIRAALQDAGPLTARDVTVRPDPYAGRGKGVGDDGSVRLAVSVVSSGVPPVVDSVHLTAEQWAAFSPKEATAGRQWALPEETARRFAPALSPMTDPILSPTPADATTARMAAKVFRVDNGVAVIRYLGQWETLHHRDGDPKYPIRTSATGEGVGVYDVKQGKMIALVWVLNGSYRNSPPGAKGQTTAAVIEWSAGSAKSEK